MVANPRTPQSRDGAAHRQNDAQAHRLFENGVQAKGATTIMRSAEDLYTAWKRWEDLPRFIDHLKSVEILDDKRTRWTTSGPGGEYSWDAEIIRDEPNRLIAWKTIGEPAIPNAGTIRFSELENDRGTQVRVTLEYIPPAGRLGDLLARFTGDSAKDQVHEGLHRFRQLMETGELSVAKSQPVGASARRADRPGEKDQRQTDADVRDIASNQP